MTFIFPQLQTADSASFYFKHSKDSGGVLLTLLYNFKDMAQIVVLIAKNIKRLRELKHLSQKEICADAGVPQGQYSRIENGKVEPSISTL